MTEGEPRSVTAAWKISGEAVMGTVPRQARCCWVLVLSLGLLLLFELSLCREG